MYDLLCKILIVLVKLLPIKRAPDWIRAIKGGNVSMATSVIDVAIADYKEGLNGDNKA